MLTKVEGETLSSKTTKNKICFLLPDKMSSDILPILIIIVAFILIACCFAGLTMRNVRRNSRLHGLQPQIQSQRRLQQQQQRQNYFQQQLPMHPQQQDQQQQPKLQENHQQLPQELQQQQKQLP